MYDFKQLSAADFEELSRDLLQSEWGIRLEAFKTGRDQGIDLRYAKASSPGLIVQCKHYSASTISKLLYDLENSESAKVHRLAPDRYAVVTSLPLSPLDKAKIQKIFHPYILSSSDVFGLDDLNNLLGRHVDIETKHFKLWLSSTAVMQRVLQNAEHVQTEFDVARIQRSIPLYVQSGNFPKAMKILEENKIVIISGVAGIGKTTLADMLLYAHLEKSFRPVVIQSEIREGKSKFNSVDQLIFYFDDFLGQTFLGNRLDFVGKNEDSALVDFIELVAKSKNARLILTTREHILQHAYQISENFQRQKGDFSAVKCVLQISDYSLVDKGRILYNHIYFSELSPAYKERLLADSFYLKILKHRNFNPRLIEWITKYSNIKVIPVSGYQTEIDLLLENPEQLWRISFLQQISDSSRAMLVALYSLGSNAGLSALEEAWKKLHRYRTQKYNLRMHAEDWHKALAELEGGFIRFENQRAIFINPSLRDFFDSLLIAHIDYVDDILSSAAFFLQIVHIWELARSDKGDSLLSYFRDNPEEFLGAIARLIELRNATSFSGLGGFLLMRGIDVAPEARLSMLISVAYRLRSKPSLDMLAKYAEKVAGGWLSEAPDFEAVITTLKLLDKVDWSDMNAGALHESIRRAALKRLLVSASSGDLVAVANYAKEKTLWWHDDDQATLVASAERYLEHDFDSELAECSDESDLDSLLEILSAIATTCDIDIDYYAEEISNRIANLEPPREENYESGNYSHDGSRPRNETEQEDEVRRIFDGLKE